MTVELNEADLDLGRWIRPGEGVAWSQACSEPVALVDAVISTATTLGVTDVYCGHTLRDALGEHEALPLRIVSHGTLGRLARIAGRRDVDIVPTHYSELPDLFTRRKLPADVVLLQLAPPDENGRCSFGMDAGYIADAARHARVVVAEINERMPALGGESVDLADLAAVMWTDRPVLTVEPRPSSATDETIADRVAELIRDGDTVQMGVGGIPDAVLRRLGHLRDLGVHSGIVSDPLIDLVASGVVTGARKSRDRSRVVAGTALGSQRLVDFLAQSDMVDMRAVSYTHRADVLAGVGRLVAINGAIEVDLTGQVGSEALGGRWLGAVGGQVDFLRGARASGGVGVIALPSTARNGIESRIVSRISGSVSTARSDTDVVVTEHGVAHLTGRTIGERALSLIAIAAPAHQEQLHRAATEQGLLGRAR